MSASQRRYAIQSRTSSEAERIDFMVRHMTANKAYRYAAADGDADGDRRDGGGQRERRRRGGVTTTRTERYWAELGISRILYSNSKTIGRR